MRMPRSFLVCLLCAAAPAFAQIGDSSTSSDDVTVVAVLNAFSIGRLIMVVIAFGALFKLYTRWPQFERWLVGASLLALPPFATYGLHWWVSLTAFSQGRDTGLFWAAVAVLLGIAWWVVKTRTTLLRTDA